MALKTPSGVYTRTNKNPNLFPYKNRFGFFLFGGPGGIRTLDLSDANRTLSQLSYRPICKAGRPILSMTNVLRLAYCTAFWRNCQADFQVFPYRLACLFRGMRKAGQNKAAAPAGTGAAALFYGCVSENIRGNRFSQEAWELLPAGNGGARAAWVTAFQWKCEVTAPPCGSGPCRRPYRRRCKPSRCRRARSWSRCRRR